MSWFKVDDRLWSHPKWIHLPLEAKALWISAGSYCAQYESDGFISRQTLAIVLPNSRQTRAATALCEARLWDEVEDGYQFRNWSKYQPTKAQKDAERADTRERVRKHRNDKRNSVTPDVTNGDRTDVPTRPDPTPISTDVDISPIAPTKRGAYGEEFNTFWDAFPSDRKGAKKQCAQKFQAAIKAGIPAETIIEAAARYKADPNREPQYTVSPHRWLNEGRWESGPLPTKSYQTDRGLAAAQRDMARYGRQQTALQVDGFPYPWETKEITS